MTTLTFSALFVAILLVMITAHPVESIFFAGAGTIREQNPRRQYSPFTDVYTVLYCGGKRCPKWNCQDDSAVIHGYCCGCINSLGGNVPVLCVDDLRCPLKMNNLCEDYRFMITCCCSGYYKNN